MQPHDYDRPTRRSYLALILAGCALVLTVGFLFFALRSAQPDAGHQVVLIHKPMIFGHGGVDPTPVSAGRKYVWWTTQMVDVNVQPVQHQIQFDDLMSSDGVPLDFGGVIRLKVTDSVALIANFGPRWYENNVEAEFRNRARQAVRKYGMNETAIDTTAIDKIDEEITREMSAYIAEAKLPLLLVDVTIGKANPPDSVKDQRIETAAQQQRIQTETQRQLAEQSRKAAEESKAAADNAYRQAMSMSPELYVELQRIEMLQEVCSKEKSGCTFITGADVRPTLNAR